MTDIAALQQACVDAELVKTDLLAERSKEREKLSKRAFREYNDASRAEQLEVQGNLDVANKAFTAALDEVRVGAVHQVVDVGTLEEGNKIGPVS